MEPSTKDTPRLSGLSTLPTLFVGHGNPMNALADNEYTRAWRTLGDGLRADSGKSAKPAIRGVLVLSAHWATKGELAVSSAGDPGLLYDMYGFPDALYRVQYPAKGDSGLAAEIARRFARASGEHSEPVRVRLDAERQLDHAVWAVLIHMFPEADLPVLHLSYDELADARAQLHVGRVLRELRDEGVLIVGSGNLVHNLREIDFAGTAPPADWAVQFDDWMAGELDELSQWGSPDSAFNGSGSGSGDWDARLLRLAEPWNAAHGLAADLVAAAERSVPTIDHYVPFVQFLGTLHPGEGIGFPVTGIQNHSISMRAVMAGT